MSGRSRELRAGGGCRRGRRRRGARASRASAPATASAVSATARAASAAVARPRARHRRPRWARLHEADHHGDRQELGEVAAARPASTRPVRSSCSSPVWLLHACPVLGPRGERAQQPVALDGPPEGDLEPRQRGQRVLARIGVGAHLSHDVGHVLPGAVGEGADEHVAGGEVTVDRAPGQPGGGGDGVETGVGVVEKGAQRGLEQAAAVDLRVPAASGWSRSTQVRIRMLHSAVQVLSV